MNPVEIGSIYSNFRWAIIEDGIISQARFDTKEAAQIAYRNHLLSREG